MKISKQKRNLINELSFYILEEIEHANENHLIDYNYKKDNIKKLINIVKSSKNYTNKQIKTLIHDLKYELPF